MNKNYTVKINGSDELNGKPIPEIKAVSAKKAREIANNLYAKQLNKGAKISIRHRKSAPSVRRNAANRLRKIENGQVETVLWPMKSDQEKLRDYCKELNEKHPDYIPPTRGKNAKPKSAKPKGD